MTRDIRKQFKLEYLPIWIHFFLFSIWLSTLFFCKSFNIFYSLVFVLYWNIVNLQLCVSFRCVAKWLRYITYVHSFFRFFYHIVYYKILSRCPLLFRKLFRTKSFLVFFPSTFVNILIISMEIFSRFILLSFVIKYND